MHPCVRMNACAHLADESLVSLRQPVQHCAADPVEGQGWGAKFGHGEELAEAEEGVAHHGGAEVLILD